MPVTLETFAFQKKCGTFAHLVRIDAGCDGHLRPATLTGTSRRRSAATRSVFKKEIYCNPSVVCCQFICRRGLFECLKVKVYTFNEIATDVAGYRGIRVDVYLFASSLARLVYVLNGIAFVIYKMSRWKEILEVSSLHFFCWIHAICVCVCYRAKGRCQPGMGRFLGSAGSIRSVGWCLYGLE